ncbi:MAG: cytochrome c-type biogenesis protein CcmH [Alphaproteobacteria bacterium]|nr:cytochrome c-type biogenesis protein CcmH [Alphaproteobacteria bacterium]
MRRGILPFLAALVLASAAPAVEPREMLSDPALEARAREVSLELRCVVCQNQSIDDSNAELAHDMRVLVRKRIAAGDSNPQVIQYLVDRYGDFVTLKPPFKASTLVLWFGPLLLLAAAVFAARTFFRRRADSPAPPPLSDEERARLDALLKDGS